MKFGSIAVAEAEGAVLAHGVKHAGGSFKKGRILSSADVECLAQSGIERITAAVLEAADVQEDEAARALAVAVAGVGSLAQQAFTGRANIIAKEFGLAVIDHDRVRAINRLHESLTIATLAPFSTVTARQMLATIKVIPFATPRHVLERALAIAGSEPVLRVAPFNRKHVSLVVTTLSNTKPSIISKTEEVTRNRLTAMGLQLSSTEVVAHKQSDVAAAIARQKAGGSDLILVFGATAIVDRADVIPAAVEETGGLVIHMGMPVDPGNLLMLASIEDVPVIGIPTCARSPKRNGFDWVLERLCAGLAVTREDLMDMGAGGLLAEIPTRPSPRDLQGPAVPRIAAVILAAGKGQRMGGGKMLHLVDGKPMILATVEQVLASGVDEVVVVTGHDAKQVESSLAGKNVQFVHNADFAQGLSSSLRVGLSAVRNADGVVVCLGDMPRVTAADIDRLIAAFNPIEHRSIVVPVHNGQFGNPVLWGAEHFPRLLSLSGDRGARSLIADLKSEATEVNAGAGVLQDADTPEALQALQAQ